jgi:hypothetical protein
MTAMPPPLANGHDEHAPAYVFIADLVTWALLISQFNIVRRPALLVLASGYLFTAMMGVPLLNGQRTAAARS